MLGSHCEDYDLCNGVYAMTGWLGGNGKHKQAASKCRKFHCQGGNQIWESEADSSREAMCRALCFEQLRCL